MIMDCHPKMDACLLTAADKKSQKRGVWLTPMGTYLMHNSASTPLHAVNGPGGMQMLQYMYMKQTQRNKPVVMQPRV
jgi:hypothetical protein